MIYLKSLSILCIFIFQLHTILSGFAFLLLIARNDFVEMIESLYIKTKYRSLFYKIVVVLTFYLSLPFTIIPSIYHIWFKD